MPCCGQEQNSAEFLADETRLHIRSGHEARPAKSKDICLPSYQRGFPARSFRSASRTAPRMSTSRRHIIRAAAAAFFAVAQIAASLIGTGPALAVDAPEGTVKSQHGDWQVVCKDPPPGAKNPICALVQSVTAEDKNNIGLTVYFQKFSNGTRVLRVFAPLGVLLPPGLGLKIDDKDVGHAPFLRCHSFACYAQVVVEDPLIEQLKTGKTAIFIIFQTEEAGIGIPISLKGFGEALGDLN